MTWAYKKVGVGNMKKSIVIGIVILLLIVGGGLLFRFMSDKAEQTTKTPGVTAEAVKPVPLTVGPASGYVLGSTDFGSGPVPVFRIPLDTWGGYAALLLANGGAKPNKDSLFYKKGKFAVELVKVEGAKAQLDGYAAGKYHLLWSSMDSMPLLYDALKADKRLIPQVIGLFDWSNGGDGILVRKNIRSPKDLKGKKILTSGNTPFNFFLLWLLAQSDIKTSEVQMMYVGDGPAAAEVFRDDKTIDAWVTWEPFLADVLNPASPYYQEGSRVLINSRDANQLIADVYFTRLDLAREQGPLLASFVECMIEAESQFTKNPEPALRLVNSFFGLSGIAEARSLVSNVHLPNYTESRMFFDIENPINASKIFYLAQEYYKAVGSLAADASYEPESVLLTKFLEQLESNKVYKAQPNRVLNSFNKQAAFDIADLESQRVVLTGDFELYFDAQKIDFDLSSKRPEMVKNKELLASIIEQMQILGTTLVKLVGHLDTSKVEEFRSQGMQAFNEASSQAKLISKRRAEFVKKVLVEQYGADPERLITEGKGWDQPASSGDAARSRRVEVRFLSFE